jgi:ABC-type Zn2+ transport system substrate-binding protein/surface adhesin
MKVIATSRIKHNGELYEAGDELEGVLDRELAQLESAGVVEIKGDSNAKKSERAKIKEELESQDDSEDEDANASRAANITPKKDMNKTTLLGIARARGLELEKTMTNPEIFKTLEADIEKRGEV